MSERTLENLLERGIPRSPKEKPITDERILETMREKHPRYCITFPETPMNCCIGLVDMVGSTKLAASLGMKKMSSYYQHFLNFMSKVILEFDGYIVKNIGDCLLFCFPCSHQANSSALQRSLQCALALRESRHVLTELLHAEGLPPVSYRISLDYGQVTPMRTSYSQTLDMIGPAVNMCSKINRCVYKNNIAIGGDLYELSKHLIDYSFTEIEGFSVGFKSSYPIYLMERSVDNGG